MKKTACLTSIAVLLTLTSAYSQMKRIEQTIEPLEAESHLRFLTSDELKGRDTGSEELIIAGRYIAEQFRRSGIVPLGDDADEYFQHVPLVSKTPATEVVVKMAEEEFHKKDLIVVSGSNTGIEAELLFLQKIEDYKNEDISGKVIVAVMQDLQSAASTSFEDLKKAGAVGLIHLYRPAPRYPWPLLQNYFNRERIQIDDAGEEEEAVFPHIWVKDSALVFAQKLQGKGSSNISIDIKGTNARPVKAFNVVGKIEGTDPELKKEHIVMSAHYDHVGIQITQDPDSIYNGTRDNGIGTTGIINAAKYFGKYPPKRSIIFIALTGEEKGLLGSRYYADNPKIPLEETVFNLNIDNSGYTDTHIITLLDTNRTNIDKLVYQAASEVELGVIGDRIPDQNYYERSDQVSFATKGVPAVNFKMAMSAFDVRIAEYYHQPSDEFQTVDLDYIHKYWKAYIRSAELIGNWEETPYWIKGDKFEPVGNELYGKK